jgi:tetratricopeptide (TPR) repeat protein
MEIELSPKILDVVEVPNRVPGSTTHGAALGTVVEVLPGPDGGLLVEVTDENGVALDLVQLPAAEAKVVWSSPELQKQASSGEGGSNEFRKGVLLLQNGFLAEAKAHFELAFKHDPRLAGTLMNLGNGLAERRLYDAAVLLYQLVLELQPENRLTRRNLAAMYINRGIQYAERGALDKAVEQFGHSLTLDPAGDIAPKAQHNLVAAYTQLGTRLAEINRHQEAVVNFFIALQIGPSDLTRRNLAIALVSLQASRVEGSRQTPSIHDFRNPVQMGLSFSECLNAFGASLANLGDLEGGRRAFLEAIRTDPENDLARINLARLDASRESAGPSWMNFGISSIEPQPVVAEQGAFHPK